MSGDPYDDHYDHRVRTWEYERWGDSWLVERWCSRCGPCGRTLEHFFHVPRSATRIWVHLKPYELFDFERPTAELRDCLLVHVTGNLGYVYVMPLGVPVFLYRGEDRWIERRAWSGVQLAAGEYVAWMEHS